MRDSLPDKRLESFHQMRQRMLDETSRFIEWGLKNPEKVQWIPKHPVGRGAFSERVKAAFWTILARQGEEE